MRLGQRAALSKLLTDRKWRQVPKALITKACSRFAKCIVPETNRPAFSEIQAWKTRIVGTSVATFLRVPRACRRSHQNSPDPVQTCGFLLNSRHADRHHPQ